MLETALHWVEKLMEEEKLETQNVKGFHKSLLLKIFFSSFYSPLKRGKGIIGSKAQWLEKQRRSKYV